MTKSKVHQSNELARLMLNIEEGKTLKEKLLWPTLMQTP